jgi:hypothetical protein
MARPKEIEPRNQQVNVKLTRAERESVVARAKASGMRPGPYGRAALLGASVQREETVGPSSAEIAFRHALKRLGQNLNQLTKHAHVTGQMLPAELEPLLREIRRLLNQSIGR